MLIKERQVNGYVLAPNPDAWDTFQGQTVEYRGKKYHLAGGRLATSCTGKCRHATNPPTSFLLGQGIGFKFIELRISAIYYQARWTSNSRSLDVMEMTALDTYSSVEARPGALLWVGVTYRSIPHDLSSAHPSCSSYLIYFTLGQSFVEPTALPISTIP